MDEQPACKDRENSTGSRKSLHGKKRSFFFFQFLYPLGLGPSEKEQGAHWQTWLNQPQNKGSCALAVLCWTIMLLWVVFNMCSLVSPSSSPQLSIETSVWTEGEEPIPELFVKTRDEDVMVEAKSCAIFAGNFAGYRKNKQNGITVEGGCEDLKFENKSDALHTWAQHGGCQQFSADKDGAFKRCWRLQQSSILGQYGGPKYMFTRIFVYVSDPAAHLIHLAYRNVAGLTADERLRSLEAKLQLKELRRNATAQIALVWKDHAATRLTTDSHDRDYTSLQLKTNCEKTLTSQKYFRPITLRRFGSLGAELFLSGIRQSIDGEAGGDVAKWTSYDGTLIDSQKLSADKKGNLLAIEITFQASPMKDEVTERPFMTWFELPTICGGFFTGFVLLISGLGTRFGWLSVGMYRKWLHHKRARESREADTIVEEVEVEL